MTYIFIGEYISLIHSLFLISSAYSMYWIQAKTKNKMYTKKKKRFAPTDYMKGEKNVICELILKERVSEYNSAFVSN